MLGLVLSGGGLYGAAHVGVLQGLQELGIRPDFVVGTSAGALVGGLWASGMSPARLHEFTMSLGPRDLPLDWRSISHSLVGRRALPDRVISDAPLARKLVACVGAMTTRTTEAPCYIVATSLNHRRAAVFGPALTMTPEWTSRFGLCSWASDIPLVTAMRASIAVPGLFRPVMLDAHLLVDGGVVDDYPMDVAIVAGATRIIGVRIQDRSLDVTHETAMPDILSTAVKSLSLMLEDSSWVRRSWVTEQFGVTSVEIPVSVSGIGVAEFSGLATLIDRGLTETRLRAQDLRAVAA